MVGITDLASGGGRALASLGGCRTDVELIAPAPLRQTRVIQIDQSVEECRCGRHPRDVRPNPKSDGRSGCVCG